MLQVQGFQNVNRSVSLDNPICFSMASRRTMTMTVEIDEAINNQTFINYIKRFTFEPYLYGIDRNQQPVLCGNIVRVEILRQTNRTYGQSQVVNALNLPVMFTGMVTWMQGQTTTPVNVWKVLQVQNTQGVGFIPQQQIMALFAPTATGINVICSAMPPLPVTPQ